jgi:hypothetical protein
MGDVACGGIPAYHEFRQRLVALNPKEMEVLMNFHRIITHVQHVELQRYHNAFNQLDNQDLRIQYLLGNLDKELMKVEVQKREKRREKERAIRRAMEVLVQAGTDLMRRLMAETDLPKKRSIISEIDALRLYVNELLAKVNDRLKLSAPQYTSNWSTIYPFSPSVKRAEKLKDEAKKAKELKEKAEKEKLEAERLAREEEDRQLNAILDEIEEKKASLERLKNTTHAPV